MLLIFLIYFCLTTSIIEAFLTGRGTKHEKHPVYPLGAHKTIVSRAFQSFFTDKRDPLENDNNIRQHLNETDLIKYVYRGDFIRDMSQFLTSPIARRLRFNYVLEALVKMESASPSNTRIGRKLMNLDGLSWRDVGYYDSREHVDQPLAGHIFVDERVNMLNYVSSGPLNSTSSGKIRENLEKVLNIWKQYLLHSRENDDADIDFGHLVEHKLFLLIGSTTHTMGDFFAHSNFMELAIMQELMRYKTVNFSRENVMQFHSTVFPFVGVDTLTKCGGRRQQHNDYCYPVVTGLTSRNVNEARVTLFSIFKTRINGVVHRRMDTKKHKSWFHHTFSNMRRKFLRKVSAVITDDALKVGRGNIPNLRSKTFTNPTHFQLNKDHSSHPLHVMAVECSIKVVTYFAEALKSFMHQTFTDHSLSMEEVDERFKNVVNTATGIFVHPYHIMHMRKHRFINNGMYECMWDVVDFISKSTSDNDSERVLEMLSRHDALMMKNRLY